MSLTIGILQSALLSLRSPRDEQGQTLAEYGLIMVIIAIAVTVVSLIIIFGPDRGD